jgi:hypothetical protein
MTLAEATARLQESANQTMSAEELRAMARERYRKDTDRELLRLLQEAGYSRIARTAGGKAELDPAFLARFRRDYTGPIDLEGIPLGEGPDVVTVSDAVAPWYIAPHGAIMRLVQWLIERLAPSPAE